MHVRWGHTDVFEVTRMVDMCLDAGLNMFDMTDMYSRGLAEEILGKAITGKRNRMLLAIKVTFPFFRNLKLLVVGILSHH